MVTCRECRYHEGDKSNPQRCQCQRVQELERSIGFEVLYRSCNTSRNCDFFKAKEPPKPKLVLCCHCGHSQRTGRVVLKVDGKERVYDIRTCRGGDNEWWGDCTPHECKDYVFGDWEDGLA